MDILPVIVKTVIYLMFKLLFFRSDFTRYALAVEAVERIVWLPALSALDNVPRWFVGLLNLKGESVPVIDFSVFMLHEARPYSPTQQLIILRDTHRRAAIIVDEVDDLKSWSGQILPLPVDRREHSGAPTAPEQSQQGQSTPDILLGEVRQDDEMVMLVNPAAVLDAPHHWPFQQQAVARRDQAVSTLNTPVFDARRHQLADELISEDQRNHVQFVVISIPNRRYAISMAQIVEFSPQKPCSFLPGCHASIAGSMNLRGEIILVVDINILLGLEPSPESSHIIIVQHGLHKLALLIRSVERLVSVPDVALAELQDHENQHPLSKSLIRDGGDLVTILNLDALVSLCGRFERA